MTTVERVSVQRVTRLYGATAALRGVSCEFTRGTMTFVQGPNGAGKSTLLNIVGTVLRPTSGQVVYEPLGSGEAARPYMGWVGHEAHCYPELTGRENVELAAEIYGVGERARIMAVCEQVGANAFFDQPVGTLSRGQKQRIALARALVHRPSVLLLDEPLSGLDRDAVRRFDEVLRAERERGAIVVVVSHQQGWAERLGARQIYMQRGRIDAVEAP